ncbi:MAG: SDR family NAD(P)-dependent oxidoreductase [Clostridia bacterium]|nr:SDR family NAD(P)-dependent oxidoreductase [Clostridia bacterium]
MNVKTALVTGGTSGIGLAAAKALAAKGVKVYCMSRRAFECEGMSHVCADVTDYGQVKAAVDGIAAAEGGIDLVVNCAGSGISGAVEFTTPEDAKRQIDVNFFGTVNVNKAVIPHMRENGGGRIVNISSVGAPAALPFQAFYSASKAAINTYTCALINELRPFGISVTAIMPGDIRTGFTAARKKNPAGDDIYGGRIERSVSKMEHDEQNGMSPEKAAKTICRVCFKKRVKPLYAIGFSYKAVCVLLKLLPCSVGNRVIGGMYAK